MFSWCKARRRRWSSTTSNLGWNGFRSIRWFRLIDLDAAIGQERQKARRQPATGAIFPAAAALPGGRRNSHGRKGAGNAGRRGSARDHRIIADKRWKHRRGVCRTACRRGRRRETDIRRGLEGRKSCDPGMAGAYRNFGSTNDSRSRTLVRGFLYTHIDTEGCCSAYRLT